MPVSSSRHICNKIHFYKPPLTTYIINSATTVYRFTVLFVRWLSYFLGILFYISFVLLLIFNPLCTSVTSLLWLVDSTLYAAIFASILISALWIGNYFCFSLSFLLLLSLIAHPFIIFAIFFFVFVLIMPKNNTHVCVIYLYS